MILVTVVQLSNCEKGRTMVSGVSKSCRDPPDSKGSLVAVQNSPIGQRPVPALAPSMLDTLSRLWIFCGNDL